MAFSRLTILSEEFKELLLYGIDKGCYPFILTPELPADWLEVFGDDWEPTRSLAEMREALTTAPTRDHDCLSYGIHPMEWEYKIRESTLWMLFGRFGV